MTGVMTALTCQHFDKSENWCTFLPVMQGYVSGRLYDDFVRRKDLIILLIFIHIYIR